MNVQDLVNALDQFDSTHNLDELILVKRPGEHYSIAVLHSDGEPRPFEEIVGSHFDISFNYLSDDEPDEDEDEDEEDQ